MKPGICQTSNLQVDTLEIHLYIYIYLSILQRCCTFKNIFDEICALQNIFEENDFLLYKGLSDKGE